MTNIIEDLSGVLALANNAAELAKNLIVITKGKNKKEEEDSVKIGSSGDSAKIGSSGDYAQIGSSGDYVKIGSSGDYAQIGSSGYSAKIGSSGDYAQIGSSGDSVKIGSSGYSAQIGSSGDSAQIGSSGYSAKIGSSGDYAQIDSSGDKAVISAIGFLSTVKAKIGSWITLAEYKYNKCHWEVDFVKTEYVDGKKIKDGQFYCLYNHEFCEYAEFDNIKCAVLSKKGNVYKTVLFDDFDSGKITYVIEKDGVYSHGDTIKDAKESFIYKISNRDTSAYENYTKDTIVSFEEAIKMYRAITGACEVGTRYFVSGLKELKPNYTIAEIIKLTEGQFGATEFKNFFKGKNNE